MEKNMSKEKTTKFPKDFIWGVATSAYQIEGYNQIEGGGECIWDLFAREGGTLNNDNGNIAADHFHRFKEDHKLAKSFGFQSFRLSFSSVKVHFKLHRISTKRQKQSSKLHQFNTKPHIPNQITL